MMISIRIRRFQTLNDDIHHDKEVLSFHLRHYIWVFHCDLLISTAIPTSLSMKIPQFIKLSKCIISSKSLELPHFDWLYDSMKVH